MLTTTLIFGMLIGGMLASFLGLFRRPAGAPAQIVTVNPVPAAARPPGCLARLGGLLPLAATRFLTLIVLALILP